MLHHATTADVQIAAPVREVMDTPEFHSNEVSRVLLIFYNAIKV
jgi:hypothetical protein